METFRGPEDYAAIEAVPLVDRIPYGSVHDMFASRAQDSASDDAILWLPNGRATDEAERISFSNLFDKICRTANLFHSLGVRKEAGVSLLLANRPETHYSLWGGSAAGVVNPINPLLSPEQIADIVSAAGSRTLVTGDRTMPYDVYEKASAVRRLCPGLDCIVVVGDAGSDEISFHRGIDMQPGSHLLSGRRFELDEPSAYFHTGGTTGTPKLAQQTHRNQLFTAWTCAFAMALSRRDRILTGLPLFHANAAISTGLSGFFASSATLLCGEEGYRSKAMISDFWPIVVEHGATIFSGVPTIYAQLLKQLHSDAPTGRLRFGLCGAAPMPVTLFRAFEERTGVKIIEGYGMTEGGAASAAHPRDGKPAIGSIGVRLPYQELQPATLDSEGRFISACEDDEVGVLLLKGPNVFPGYKQERHNREIWAKPGWFNTGDLGRRDPEGVFWLAGRAKDLIIRSGHNIDPAVIEETLHQHPDVELAAAVGKPCAYAGELPVAYVKLKAGMKTQAGELKAFAREHIVERSAAPADIIIIDAMPITAVGKTFKPALRMDATARVYREVLEGLPVRVRVYQDDRRGLVAVVSGEDSQTLRNAVSERLSHFAVPFDYKLAEPNDFLEIDAGDLG